MITSEHEKTQIDPRDNLVAGNCLTKAQGSFCKCIIFFFFTPSKAQKRLTRITNMKLLLSSLLFVIMTHGTQGIRLRGRNLQNTPYFLSSDPSLLGEVDLSAAIGNPLKGLIGGARFGPPPLPDSVPLSMEFYNFGLNEFMTGDNQFNWTVLDTSIASSASRNMHVVISVSVHWPRKPLFLPPHLLDIDLFETQHGLSPNYGDERLLKALRQYIFALGERYDGDKRIANIHLGLLGFCKFFLSFVLPLSSLSMILSY